MKKKSPIAAFFSSREGALAIFVILCFVILCVTTNLIGSLFVYLRDLSYLLVGGLALMMVILLGEIDISSGTVLGLIGFCSFTLEHTIQKSNPMFIFINGLFGCVFIRDKENEK